MAETLQKNKQRPVYRNIAMTDLAHYRLPLPGIASIAHRISGVALFVFMIFLLPMLQMSLKSDTGFDAFRSVIWANPIAKIVLLGLLLALVYHLFAGIRHMIQDGNKWLDLDTSKKTAAVVFALSAVVTAVIAWRLW